MPLTQRDLDLRRWATALMEEIEAEGFTCEGGPIENHIAWRKLRELADNGIVDQGD